MRIFGKTLCRCAAFIRFMGYALFRKVYMVYCRCAAFMGYALFMGFIAAARRLWGLMVAALPFDVVVRL
jgi:hypothetical protein